MHRISNFRRPRGHPFFPKNGSYRYGAKLRWGPRRVHLWANGVVLGPKMGQNHKKLTCPKTWIFDYPAVIDFSEKMKMTVMAPNHGGDPLGSIFRPMGSHWVKKWVKIVKIYMPQNSNFRLPRGHWFFPQKLEVTVIAPNHGGDPLGSILVPMGSHWVEKMGQNRKNYHAPKFEFSTSPRSSIFLKRWKLRLWRQITVGTP